MDPDTYRRLQLKFGKVAFDLKTQRRMTPAEMRKAMLDFDGKLSDRTVETEAQADAEIAALRAKYANAPKRGGVHPLVPLEELRRRAKERMVKARRH